MNTQIDPHKTNSVRLAELLTDEFIFGDRNHYINSKWAEELIRRGEEAIPHIGSHLKSIEQKMEKLLAMKDREEVEQGWISLLCKIVRVKKINMAILVTNYQQWVNWAFNFRP